jgi:hypothetical protein
MSLGGGKFSTSKITITMDRLLFRYRDYFWENTGLRADAGIPDGKTMCLLHD